MQKALVETTGSFQLVDFNYSRQTVDAFRPSVVVLSDFFQARVAIGQIKVIGTVTDEATDEEFQKYWSEAENTELAVDSFLAAFSDAEPSKKTVKAPAAKKAAPAKDAE